MSMALLTSWHIASTYIDLHIHHEEAYDRKT